MDAKPAADSRAEITHLMGVTDANNRGNIHGGTVMKLADEAAALAAIKHSRQRVVTVGMDRMNFLVPIYVGELVTFRATVNAAWRTSMEVGVKAMVEDVRKGGGFRQVASAYLTFVAVDATGKSIEVPQVITETEHQKRRFEDAGRRREMRSGEVQRRKDLRATLPPEWHI